MLVKLVCIIVVGKDGVACCGLPQISEAVVMCELGAVNLNKKLEALTLNVAGAKGRVVRGF